MQETKKQKEMKKMLQALLYKTKKQRPGSNLKYAARASAYFDNWKINNKFHQFQTCTEEKYDVKRCVEEAAIVVTNSSEPHVSCTITLTSPIMRESAEGGGTNWVTGSRSCISVDNIALTVAF